MKTGRNDQNAIARLGKTEVVSLQTFLLNMKIAQCSCCDEMYVSHRSHGKQNYYFLTTTHLSGAKNIAFTNLYIVPISEIKHEHDKLPPLPVSPMIAKPEQKLLK